MRLLQYSSLDNANDKVKPVAPPPMTNWEKEIEKVDAEEKVGEEEAEVGVLEEEEKSLANELNELDEVEEFSGGSFNICYVISGLLIIALLIAVWCHFNKTA